MELKVCKNEDGTISLWMLGADCPQMGEAGKGKFDAETVLDPHESRALGQMLISAAKEDGEPYAATTERYLSQTSGTGT